MSDEGLSVVAGEQVTEGEHSAPDAERQEAMAAVKKAIADEAKREGESAAKQAKDAEDNEPLRPRDNTERDEAGKFVSKGTPKPEKEDEEDGQSLRKILNARKEVAANKQQMAAETQKSMQQLQQFKAQIDYERQQLAQEKQRMAMLRNDPIRAIKENGWDPENFILNIASDGTPEGQAMRAQREMANQLKEIRDWKEEQLRQREQQEAQFRQRQEQERRQGVEREFVGLVLNEEKHPHLSSYYKDNDHGLEGLITEGDSVAFRYRQKTGKEATLGDIVEYLEERMANWYKSRSGPQAKSTVTKGRPTQGSATGRTLSPEDSSERRSLGTPLKDLDGDERLAAAREAVGAALRASGEHR